MPHTINDSILQDFSRNPQGQLCLHFSDPAYVSSEIIILDRKDKTMFAVLHGATHLIGTASADLLGGIKHNDEIILIAPHYHSGTLNLHARISVI